MDDFLGFLVMVIYLIAVFSGKKKKNQKAKQKQRRNFERAFASRAQENRRQMERGAKTDVLSAEAIWFPEHEACEAQRVHLHTVTQQQMHEAGEGEDPCHAGSATEIPDETILTSEEETDSELAKDVLRGVIMSEILMRPCERMAIKRNGRSAT